MREVVGQAGAQDERRSVEGYLHEAGALGAGLERRNQSGGTASSRLAILRLFHMTLGSGRVVTVRFDLLAPFLRPARSKREREQMHPINQ